VDGVLGFSNLVVKHSLMKEKFLFSGLLVLASLLTISLTLADADNQNLVTSIEVHVAKDFSANHEDAIIMDVRTPIEYEISHITDAININVQDKSFDTMIVTLDPKKTYIVHCTKNTSNGRSNRALQTLQNLGFKHLYSLEGGYIAWKTPGYRW
jgi:phage shock protein E